MNYMSHTDCTEGTEEEPNSALLLERLKEHEYRESNSPVDCAACDDKHKPYKTNSLTPNPSPKERGVIRLDCWHFLYS